MANYACVECGKNYTEANMPESSVCQDANCPGEGLMGLIIPVEGDGTVANTSFREAGLCVLLMDASGSMVEQAFSDSTTHNMSKREIVANAIAAAIFGLKQMGKKDTAYICAIAFDHTQRVLFTKTVEQILDEYGNAQALAAFILKNLTEMNGGTDINSALNMGYSFIDKFLKEEIAAMGSYSPIVHKTFSPILNRAVDVPNVRVMIYTDGEQLGQYGSVQSPFKGMEVDLLLGAYIGKEGENGCNQLRSIVSKCPVHGNDQFFVLDSPTKLPTLRGVFKMASGTSGFCPACLQVDTSEMR